MKKMTREQLKESVLAKIIPEPMSGCWLWMGGHDPVSGYGNAGYLDKNDVYRSTTAHRAVWIILKGMLRRGRVLDHLCLNHACVNPDHLEPVTQKVNVARAIAECRANL